MSAQLRVAGLKIVDHGFQSAADHYKMRQGVVRISTGSRELDNLLGGMCSCMLRLNSRMVARRTVQRTMVKGLLTVTSPSSRRH